MVAALVLVGCSGGDDDCGKPLDAPYSICAAPDSDAGVAGGQCPNGDQALGDIIRVGTATHPGFTGAFGHGGLNQVWYRYPSRYTGYEMLVNGNSGKCLDVPGGGTTSGATLQQYDCNNGPNQAWSMSFYPPTGIRFSPASAPSLCLSIDPNGHAAQATCLGADVQRWYQFWNPSPSRHP